MIKDLTQFLFEQLNEDENAKIKELEKKLDEVEKKAEDADKEANKAEESIKSEEDFRDYAENKFKEVFGDDLDEEKMKETIDGLLNDNKDLVDAGKWGELVGMLNKSFAK